MLEVVFVKNNISRTNILFSDVVMTMNLNDSIYFLYQDKTIY